MMKIKPFQLERYFARYEFEAPYLLSASDPSSLTLQALLAWADAETSALWEALSLGYTESQGHPLLRKEIASLYQHVTPAGVLTAVPEEGIFITMQTLLEPGDHIIVTYPGYQSLYEIAQALGCRVTRWTLQPQGNAQHPQRSEWKGWELDWDFLKDNITSRTRMLVVNFPHNPTGYLPSEKHMNRLVQLARRHDLYLFGDEMYRFLEYDPARRLPAVCDLYERGVSLFGLSKTFALPGLRLGWLATQDQEALRKFIAFKDYTTICGSAPGEILGIIALRAREAIVARNLGIIRENLALAERFFAAHPHHFDWFRPQAGSVAFPRLASAGPVERFCQELLEAQGVMLLPGEVFDFPGDHFRLGLGREDFPQALKRLQTRILG